MMCFLGPDGLLEPMTPEPDGEATALVGVCAPDRLGEGIKPLFEAVPPIVDEDIPATLLTASPEATAATEATEPATTLGEAQALSSFLEP